MTRSLAIPRQPVSATFNGMSGEQPLADDIKHGEKVRLAGWTAGATEQDKSTNPHRGKKNEDEKMWDLAWEQGYAGKDYTAWG